MEKDFYLQYATVEDKHWWFVARRQILDRVIRKISLPIDAKILEAGCGTGGNLRMLARYGEVSAMELDETACEFANQRQVTAVRLGSLPDKIPFTGKYDLIVAFDVIEHLDNDLAALSALRSHLKPGGWIILTVPAYQFLWSQHDDINHHKRRYRLQGLQKVVRKADFSIRYSSYFNTFLFPLVAGVRLLQNLFKLAKKSQNHKSQDNQLQTSSDLTLPSPLINKFLTFLFASERHFMGKLSLPFGVSALVVAQNI
ncbi:MAG: class I SAM-dependent methyltransferase [Methylacidiphilales bacterium]|nr:class I SAM-dependent methyltransferase [Candidatus Methylacidiphilales bacterium]NJR14691.1 class I SAM-dependent methyltransferase [Calothrix sp. CSU_2_0]